MLIRAPGNSEMWLDTVLSWCCHQLPDCWEWWHLLKNTAGICPKVPQVLLMNVHSLTFSSSFSLPLLIQTYVWLVTWLFKDQSEHLWTGSTVAPSQQMGWACVWHLRTVHQKRPVSHYCRYSQRQAGIRTGNLVLKVAAQLAPSLCCCNFLFSPSSFLSIFYICIWKITPFYWHSMPDAGYTLL